MARVKTFNPGGLLVETYRNLTPSSSWELLPFPSVAHVSAVQYPGAQVSWKVKSGDRVEEEQLLAEGSRTSDVGLHSPIPGVVESFREVRLADGSRSQVVMIRLDGAFRKTGRPSKRVDWTALSSERLIRLFREQGVPLFSSSLDFPIDFSKFQNPVTTLIVNAVQGEPYLTLGMRILEDRTEDLLEGIRILQRAFQVGQTHLAVDPEDPSAWQKHFADTLEGIHIHFLRSKYPQAQRDVLLSTLGFADQPPESVLIVEPSTVLAIFNATVWNRAYVEKSVVVSGDSLTRPGVYRVRIGTPISEVVRSAGGKTSETLILHGGPFRGTEVNDLSSPVMKSTQAILLLDRRRAQAAQTLACIHCGACANVCPVGIRPLHLLRALEVADTQAALTEGLKDCVSCGLCTFVCPSRIPLLDRFLEAKGELLA